MCQALAGVVGSTESKRSDASKDELHPCGNWHSLANETMGFDHDLPHLPMYALLKVEFQVDAHSDLRDQHQHDVGNELGVDVLGELPALMLVTKEVSYDSEQGTESLYWDMPFGADDLEPLVIALVAAPWSRILTPNTIPVGKMIPQANVCTKMCIHNIESIGSGDMAFPSGILSEWCSCPVTTALRSSAAAATAVVLYPIMMFVCCVALPRGPGD